MGMLGRLGVACPEQKIRSWCILCHICLLSFSHKACGDYKQGWGVLESH